MKCETNATKELKTAFDAKPAGMRKLAFEQPDNWEFLLVCELLEEGLEKPIADCASLAKRTLLIQKRNLDYLASARFFSERWNGICIFLEARTAFFNSKVVNSLGGAGDGEDLNPVEVKAEVDKILKCARAVVQWEREVLSVVPNDEFREIHTNLRDLAQTTVINPLKSLTAEIQNIFAQPNPEGQYTFVIEMDFPADKMKSIEENLARLQKKLEVFDALDADIIS